MVRRVIFAGYLVDLALVAWGIRMFAWPAANIQGEDMKEFALAVLCFAWLPFFLGYKLAKKKRFGLRRLLSLASLSMVPGLILILMLLLGGLEGSLPVAGVGGALAVFKLAAATPIVATWLGVIAARVTLSNCVYGAMLLGAGLFATLAHWLT